MKLSQSINPMKKGQRIISSEDGRLIARVEPEEIENFADVETYAKDFCDSYNSTIAENIDPNSVKELKEALESAAFILYRADKGTAGNRVYNQIQQALKNSTL